MGKFFFSASSLGVLFIPLLTFSKVGIVELMDDYHKHTNNDELDVLMLIKQLGELREEGLISEEEFNSKKKVLLDHI